MHMFIMENTRNNFIILLDYIVNRVLEILVSFMFFLPLRKYVITSNYLKNKKIKIKKFLHFPLLICVFILSNLISEIVQIFELGTYTFKINIIFCKNTKTF